ncbi:hypothetical protein BYT27DRAFT_7249614 [Phlegmacium glaucopus]|nr:hypothetical protein BYT27DRAFT_7249614 [Phlegmacium glaucopus]
MINEGQPVAPQNSLHPLTLTLETSCRHSHSFTLILAFSHSPSVSGSGIVLYQIDHHELSNTGTIFASVAFPFAPTVPSLANDSLHSHSLAMTRSTATMTMPPWMRQDS